MIWCQAERRRRVIDWFVVRSVAVAMVMLSWWRCYRKQGNKLRRLMTFAWPCLLPKMCVDPATKYHGHLLLSHIIAKFAIHKRIVLQVYMIVVQVCCTTGMIVYRYDCTAVMIVLQVCHTTGMIVIQVWLLYRYDCCTGVSYCRYDLSVILLQVTAFVSPHSDLAEEPVWQL